MSFFYDLNARLAKLASKQDAKQISEEVKASAPKSRLAESLDVAEAGYSAKAGRAGKDLGKPGKNFSKIAKSAGERYGSKAAGERVAGAVLNKLRHPKEDIENEGNAFTGALNSTPKGGKFKVGGKEFTDTSSLEEVDMTPKQKSFAKLAPPTDKITFADKIAGAKQEVDEMLGDVAAEAMKSAVKKMGEADVTGLGEEEMDEGFKEMDAWLKSREKEKGTGRFDKKKISTGTVYTRKPETFDDPETDPEATGGAPKRKGRPTGTKRAIGAKHSGRSKLASKDAIAEEGNSSKERAYNEIIELLKNSATDINPAIRNRLMRLVRTLTVSEPVAEKAPPGAKAERMVKHIKKSLSKDGKLSDKDKAIAYATTWKAKKAGKVEEESTDKEDTKAERAGEEVTKDIEWKKGHKAKADPKAERDGEEVTHDIEHDDKKDRKEKKADKKEEKVDETTTSGSVATATATPKASKGMQFGKGVYEGLSSKLENMITESMNVTVNMSADEQGEAQKSITVTATNDDADKLAELLKMAGIEQKQETCSVCGEADCGCGDEMVDENSPDWPIKPVYTNMKQSSDPISNDLVRNKQTGQTTVPVVASQLRRTSTMEENVELERSLFKTWKNYKG